MNQPSKPNATGATGPGPAPASTEIVTRPDPGLARGKWEAPEAAFWVALAVLVVVAAAYLLHRLGILKLKKKRDGESPPPSSKVRRS